MIELEEENIMLENKNYYLVFSIEYHPQKVFVSIYDKNYEDYLVTDFEIKGNTNTLLENIRKAPGTLYKRGTKFLVRNYDKCIWSSKQDRIPATSENSVYDTRNDNYTITSLLKEAWLKI